MRSSGGGSALTVLVLGANGFIGSRLVKALLRQGCAVRILTRKSMPSIDTQVDVYSGDLTDPALDLDHLIEGCDVIINCAGEIKQERLMHALHVESVKRLLAAVARRHRDNKRFRWVQLSSVGAYGPAVGVRRVVTEQSPVNPQGTYEITKTQADNLISTYPALQGDGADWVVLRPSNVFAKDMPNSSVRQLGSIIRKKLFFYVGFKEATATYIHADDVAAALVQCAFDQRASQKVYNLSNDCSLREVVNALAKHQGVPAPRMRVPESLVRLAVWLAGKLLRLPLTQGRVDALVSQTTYPADRIKSDLGFVPKKTVPQQIFEVVE